MTSKEFFEQHPDYEEYDFYNELMYTVPAIVLVWMLSGDYRHECCEDLSDEEYDKANIDAIKNYTDFELTVEEYKEFINHAKSELDWPGYHAW